MLAMQKVVGSSPTWYSNFMSDFDTLLNAEIVEAGRVPDVSVVERTRTLYPFIEKYYPNQLNVVKPIVSTHSDIIMFTDDNQIEGFALYIYKEKMGAKLEEELVYWNNEENRYCTVRGTLQEKDFDYVFAR